MYNCDIVITTHLKCMFKTMCPAHDWSILHIGCAFSLYLWSQENLEIHKIRNLKASRLDIMKLMVVEKVLKYKLVYVLFNSYMMC